MARRIPTPSQPAPRRRPLGQQPQGTVPEGLDLDEELTMVLGAWRSGGTHGDQTLARMSETVARFARRLAASGTSSLLQVGPSDAWGFITAPTSAGEAPEVATQHARRTALRTLYKTLRRLGYPVADPTMDLVLPARGRRSARPLTDDEVTLCRAAAQMFNGRWASARATAWALGEATAVSSEITKIRIKDLDDPHHPGRVHLPGTRRHDPRIGTLTVWGRRVVARRVAELTAAGHQPGTLLAYGGAAPPGGAKAQASVCNALRDVLDAAGLSSEPDVRPGSLRHWAGRSAFDAGAPIEQVARLLGHRSLDAAAEDITLDWRQPGHDPPSPAPIHPHRHPL